MPRTASRTTLSFSVTARVRGKRLVLVDDSLVRGTTMQELVKIMRGAGASEVHLRISCPPHRHPCYYGVDFATRGELLAATHTREEMEKKLHLDSLRYISIDGLLDATGGPRENFCTACFNGCYPVPPVDAMADKYRMGPDAEVYLEELAEA